MFKQTVPFLAAGFRQSLSIFWTLLKIVVPVMIVVRIGIGFGLHLQLARLMDPVTSLLGLPAESGLVLVTTLFAGFYGGAAVMVAMISGLDMTVAQATVLTTVMVVAHAFPIEQQIIQKAGVRIVIATGLRLVVALLLGWFLHSVYSFLDVLTAPLVVSWAPDTQIDAPWPIWAQDSLRSLLSIFAIIVVLIYGLRLMDVTGATRWVTRGLSPFLTVMGISKDATTVTMTGVLLGLGFGGALIIHEAQSGKLGPRTLFLSLVFMSLCHGLIEDTLFALLLGGHISGVFFGRVLCAVVVMIAINKLIRKMPDRLFYRFLFIRPKSADG
ncbi:MAG: hypothetical protein HQ483_16100 [Rhodospirillales bacterium]|nr:hypothetical protein [Rhodospirillales bacterium]